MLDVVFRQQALEDLQNIASYIAERDQQAARRVLQRIHSVIFRTLARLPGAGRLDTSTGTREFPVRGLPYVVIYVPQSHYVDVIAIYHGAGYCLEARQVIPTEVSPRPLVRQDRLPESFEQRAVDRVRLRIVFGVPLDAERERRRAIDADRFRRSVLGNAFDDDPLSGLQDALTVERIHPYAIAAEQFREDAVRRELHIMAVGEDDGRIGMDLTAVEARHPMVHAAGNFADLGM